MGSCAPDPGVGDGARYVDDEWGSRLGSGGLVAPRPEAEDEASFRRLIFATLAERRQLSLSFAELQELVIGWHRARVAQLLAPQGVDEGEAHAQG